MTTPEELREKAERYRRMTFGIVDRRIVDALDELAAEYEKRAEEMEQRER
jgi:hypothetical protein